MRKTKMAKTIAQVSPQKPGKSPERTQTSNSGEETFLDFAVRNIEELSDKVYEKHDLSQPFPGICLFAQEINKSELISRTSETFHELLSKSGSKFYEHYVHVSGISDYINTLTIDTLEVYLKLRSQALKLTTIKKKDIKDKNLKDLKEAFPTNEDVKTFISEAEKRIKGYHRFYSAEKKIKGNLITCSVRFFDQGNLEYGIFEEAIKQVDVQLSKNFTQRIASAKKELKIKSKPKKIQQKSSEIVENSGPGLVPSSFTGATSIRGFGQ
tara:strand:- start:56 stop:859 length:804 start_codon:yes stop_codon:yes gene_type:complete